MLKDFIIYPSSEYIVIFIHGLNYYGAKYHYIGTKTIRKLLNISSVLFYKNPTDIDLNNILLSFNKCIQDIKEKIILVGHSVGGTYARYISKNNSKIYKIITLDSSYYPEYIPFVLKSKNIPIIKPIIYSNNSIMMNSINYINLVNECNIDDTLIDHNEEKNIYYNSFITGDICFNEIAFFYEEDQNISSNSFNIRKINDNYYYIYLPKYHHSAHMNKNIALFLINFIN